MLKYFRKYIQMSLSVKKINKIEKFFVMFPSILLILYISVIYNNTNELLLFEKH